MPERPTLPTPTEMTEHLNRLFGPFNGDFGDHHCGRFDSQVWFEDSQQIAVPHTLIG